MSITTSQQAIIQLKQGLRANVDKTTATDAGVVGEPAYTTDTGDLWIHDGTTFQPVPTLNMAIVNNGSIITNGGEIVWLN